MRTLASGTRMFVPSLVMVLAWKLLVSGQETIRFITISNVKLYVITIVLLTLLTCVYTAIGGIKAVIWTDVVQATLMFASALIAMYTLLYHIGGDNLNPMPGLRAVARTVPQMTTS